SLKLITTTALGVLVEMIWVRIKFSPSNKETIVYKFVHFLESICLYRTISKSLVWLTWTSTKTSN
ncbi:hypothetical protein HDU99_008991, partial [Rhizoclosmatium hyalinum]